MLKNSLKNLTSFHSLSYLPMIITKLLKTTSKQVKFGGMWTDSGLLYVLKALYTTVTLAQRCVPDCVLK